MWNLFSRLPFIATLITLMAVVIMFALGAWQLDRAEEKSLRLESIKQASASGYFSLKNALSRDDLIDQKIEFLATPSTNKYFLLDNKTHQGRVGYQVLVPMETSSGILIANWGWIAATNSRDKLPEVQLDPGQHLYRGMISYPTKNILVKETAYVDDVWPKVLQQADIAEMKRHYKQTLLPFIALLDEDPNSGLMRKWQSVVMPPEKHVAYAIQWFLLGFAALVVFAFAQIKKFKKEQQ